MRSVPESSARATPSRWPSRLAAATALGALLLAACGGGSDPAATDATAAEVEGAQEAAAETVDESGDDAPAVVADGDGLVDLVGPDVVESAEIGTNQLPSVVLDDVTTGRKVNFRNLVPQDKPILLWMYAPH